MKIVKKTQHGDILEVETMRCFEFNLRLIGWGSDVDDAFETAIKRLVMSPKECLDQEVEFVEIEYAPSLIEIAEVSTPIGGRDH